MNQLINETFALREGESIQVFEEQPTEGRWFAVKVLPCEFPPGKMVQTREIDGASIEMKVVVAAELTENGWKWLSLSQPTKEGIGDFLFDVVKAEPDQWYYVAVTDNPPMSAT